MTTHSYTFGPFSLDLSQEELSFQGSRISLHPRAFQVLQVLLEHHGQIVRRRELLDAVWGETSVQDENLTQCIYELRKVLEMEPSWGALIETIPKRGYRFCAEVQQHENSTSFAVTGICDQPAGAGRTIATTDSESGDYVRKLCNFGSACLNAGTTRELQSAAQCFARAVQIDPRKEIAWAGWAHCQALLGCSMLAALPPREAVAQASRGVTNALSIRPALPGAHATLAFIRWRYDWDWSGAEEEFRLAIELAPTDITTRLCYARYLVSSGRMKAAAIEIHNAAELSPTSSAMNIAQGWIACDRREYDRAVRELSAAIETNSCPSWARTLLSIVYIATGDYSRALVELRRAATTDNTSLTIGLTGMAFSLSGDRKTAIRLVKHLIEQSRIRYICPSSVALVYIGLQQPCDALTWLDKAIDLRAPSLVYLATNPLFNVLSSYPAFVRLRRHVFQCSKTNRGGMTKVTLESIRSREFRGV